jgi:hypothetical protein
MTREIPPRYYVWLRWMRIYRKCYVSSRAPINPYA